MQGLLPVSIDFQTSHLVFPQVIGAVLLLLLLAILIRDRRFIAVSADYWGGILREMDRMRFFGTIALTILYFALMVPIGRVWPNSGMGFLITSIPYILIAGLLLMHDRTPRRTGILVLVAAVVPVFSWWLFTYPLFLTLP
jgi:hypothetical protein